MRGQNPFHCSSLFLLYRGEFSNTKLLSLMKASAVLIADVLYSCPLLPPSPVFFGGKLLLAVSALAAVDMANANHLLVLHACSSRGYIFLLGQSGEPEQGYLAGVERARRLGWGLLDCAEHTNCHSNSWEPVMIGNTI